MAGITIRSTLSLPQTFDDALNFLFRRWTFEPEMMNQVSRREKDVIKNEFAKLGLFENREKNNICRKLNRFFTTHTFAENSSSLKSNEITKFIIENQLIDLFKESFIDHDYVKMLLDGENTNHPMHNELTFLEATKDLLSKETNLRDFVKAMNATTQFIQIYDKSFNANSHELRFMNGIIDSTAEDFHKIADTNSFTRNLYAKLSGAKDEVELPCCEQLLENFHSINLKYIRDEFQNCDIPSFDDVQISSVYGEKIQLNYLNYVERGQGTFATCVFINEMVRNSMTVTRQQINNGCEEVAKLAIQSPENETLVTHVIAFLETFSIDTRNLRCLLQLLKLKGNREVKNFEKYLDDDIKMSTKNRDLRNTEALEVYWKVKKFSDPQRSYLNDYIQKDDWLRLILMAQYFDYPLKEFVKILQERIKNKTLRENLIRAISYEAPIESKRRCSFSKRIKSKPESESQELFKNGKYLEQKNDLFAIILRCNENVSRLELPFGDFQKFFTKSHDTELDDLLFQAKKHDWPIICVLAATTKVYRFKYCWLTWLILSSNYKWIKKFENIEELAVSVFEHCLTIGFIRTLDEGVQIFYPDTPLKTLTTFLRRTAKGNFNDMEALLKLFIVQLSDADYKMIVLKRKEQLIPFVIRCLIIHLQSNIKFSVQQEEYLDCLHRSEVAKFEGKIDFQLMQKLCKILDYTNVKINYEVFCEGDKSISKEIDKICDELINNNYFEAAIEIANLMNKSKTDFVWKWWLHQYKNEDQRHTTFDIGKYMKYVEIYELDMDIFIKFLKLIVDEMDHCVDKYNIMIFILRNTPNKCSQELDEIEYEIHRLFLKLRVEKVNDIKPMTSLYYENVIKNERLLIHLSLFELKSIAKIDELSVSYRSISDESEIKALDELMHILLDLGDIPSVMRIQEMFGYAPEDLKILVYMLSVCEGLTSIYDISKQERQTISNYGQMSNRFNRFTLRSLKTSSTSKFFSFN